MTNKQFIRLYLNPLGVLKSMDPNTVYKTELTKRVDLFLSNNDSLDLPSFKENAKSAFGDEVEACNKIIHYKKLDSINQKLLFFMVLTIISIAIGVLFALSTL